jgi:hypothetical protein
MYFIVRQDKTGTQNIDFSTFHGKEMIRIVIETLNKTYEEYMAANRYFEGSVSILAHSLGGIIMYDILCNHGPAKDTENNPFRHVDIPLLKFRPHFLFSMGSAIAGTLVIRGQKLEDYKIPEWCTFHNVFDYHDPLVRHGKDSCI